MSTIQPNRPQSTPPTSSGRPLETSQETTADGITLSLAPDQIANKSIQDFIRTMVKEGTPVQVNFVGAGSNNTPDCDLAEQLAQDALITARQAQAAADRATAVAQRIAEAINDSAPPVYSEG